VPESRPRTAPLVPVSDLVAFGREHSVPVGPGHLLPAKGSRPTTPGPLERHMPRKRRRKAPTRAKAPTWPCNTPGCGTTNPIDGAPCRRCNRYPTSANATRKA
jgi:hypothetical protein